MDNKKHDFNCPRCHSPVKIISQNYLMDFVQNKDIVHYYHRDCGLGRIKNDAQTRDREDSRDTEIFSERFIPRGL